MKPSLAILLLGLMSASAAHAGPAEEAFTRDMLRRAKAALPQSDFRVSPDEPLVLLRGKKGSADQLTINLHRIFNFCSNVPAADCDTLKREFVSKIDFKVQAPDTRNLRVIVRDRGYLDYIRQAMGENLIEPRQIGDDLYVFLAFDSPDTIAVATADMLKESKLTAEEAWLLAMSQTKAVLPSLPDGKSLAQNAAAYEGKEYLGSLLADVAAWRPIAANAGPDMFVTVVSDQFVFVGQMPDGADLDRFKQVVAKDCGGQTRCISDKIYRFRNDRWVVAN